jgi:hypothetical protein
MRISRSKALMLTVLGALLLAVSGAWALEPGADGYYHTGSGVRVKSVAFVDVKVYSISHFTKKLPDGKSKRAVIDVDADKKLVWKMLRDVDAEKIQGALRDAFAMNGYADGGKIGKFLGAFSKELKETSAVTIVYNAEKKTTTVTVQGGGSATVEGVDFMKGVWSIWFGKIDQPKLGDAMISKL